MSESATKNGDGRWETKNRGDIKVYVRKKIPQWRMRTGIAERPSWEKTVPTKMAARKKKKKKRSVGLFR